MTASIETVHLDDVIFKPHPRHDRARTDLTMRDVMDGIVMHSQASGVPGANHSANEPIYTLTSTPCPNLTNEECSTAQACVRDNDDYVCHTGDPHGANIYDTVLWINVAAILGGAPGLGDVISTLASSPCLGNASNTILGYRTD